MREHEQNKLDEIFREGLAQGSFPYDTDSWNQLTPALDRLANRRKRLLKRTAAFAVLGLCILTAILLKNNPDPYSKADNPQASVKKILPDTPQKQQKPKLPVPALAPGETKSTHSTKDSTLPQYGVDTAQSTEKKSIRPYKHLKTSPRQILPTNPAEANQPITPTSTPHHASNQIRRRASPTSPFSTSNPSNLTIKQSEQPFSENPVFPASDSTYTALVLHPLALPKLFLSTPPSPKQIDQNTQSVLPTTSKTPRLPGQHRFFIRLDLNGGLTATSEFENAPGTALGLGVRAGYRIGDNTRMLIGANWTTLQFQTEEEGFQTPSDFWKIPGEIEYTKGTWSLLEIPVELETSWSINSKKYLFAGISAASTILLTQAYTFEFEEDQPGEPQTWETQEVSKYIAGYAQVQAGFAHTLGNRGSIRIAPYLQIPLTGLGIGRVHIFRFGLGLHIQPF